MTENQYSMPKLCTYVVDTDKGLAPNPLWGWCTLASCPPNHQGARLEPGDWIAGFLGKNQGHRILYAMVIDEKLHLNDYFHDPRFALKKPDPDGNWMARCGDNIYSQTDDGNWNQHPTIFHRGEKQQDKDTRKPYVYVGNQFWYFGREAKTLPDCFRSLVGGRGIRMNHPRNVEIGFRNWIYTFIEGIHGLPKDNPDLNKKAMIKGWH